MAIAIFFYNYIVNFVTTIPFSSIHFFIIQFIHSMSYFHFFSSSASHINHNPTYPSPLSITSTLPLPATPTTNNTSPISPLFVANTGGWSSHHCSTYNFCGIMSPLLPLCPPWTHSSLLLLLNCCIWYSIFLNFSLTVCLSNAPKLIIILKIQLLVSFIFLFFFYFILFFLYSILVFLSIFLLTTFCCLLATNYIHFKWNYTLFFHAWDCFLT